MPPADSKYDSRDSEIAGTDPASDELSMEPLDERVSQHRQAIGSFQPGSSFDPIEEPPRPHQFSIRSLVTATTLIAGTVGICQLLAPRVVAGGIGFMTLISLILLVTVGRQWHRARMVWACLILVYVVFAVVATVNLM